MLKFRVDYKPTPLKRPRLTRIGGKPVIYDASKKDKKDWLNLARIFSPETPYDGPLRMHLEFYFPRPKNHYRTGKYSDQLKPSAPHIHTNMPDVDNLSKFRNLLSIFIPSISIYAKILIIGFSKIS